MQESAISFNSAQVAEFLIDARRAFLYRPGMNSNQLKREACREMHARLSAHSQYVLAMKERMELRRFAASDPLYVSTCEAYHALCDVLRRLHALSLRGTGYDVRTNG